MTAKTSAGPSVATLSRGLSRKQSYRDILAVVLAPVPYALAFTGLHCIHAVCAIYCFAAAKLFEALPAKGTMYYLDFYAATLPSKHFFTVAKAHYVVGAIHCFFIAVPLLQIVARFPCIRVLQSRTASVFRTRSVFSAPDFQHKALQKARRAVRPAYSAVFARRGFFGVESKHFDSLFLFREVYDVVTQTYQAYQMTQLLPRPMLNRFYVATLVVNCWSTPLIHRYVKSVALQRVLCHVCDMVLDFISAVGVPLFLTLGYLQDYDSSTGDIPDSFWWDTQWFIHVINESPLILFGSWMDAFNRLGFSIALLASLDDVKLLLQHRKATRGKSPQATVPLPDAVAKPPPKPSVPAIVVKPSTRRYAVFTIIHRLMFAYGLAVLGVHLHSELRPDPSSSCILRVRPWLITQPACALMELNCFKDQQLTGNAVDFDAVFGDLNALALEQIVIRHCANVQIQPTIQRFHNLIGLKLYNTTLESWDEDAALTEIHHKRLRSVFFLRTQFANASLPPGLLSHEFPTLLRDVEFSVTNLRWIAPDLHERWPPRISLCLEFSELTEYPLTFTKAQFYSLTLHYNHIPSVPAEAFAIAYIALTGNPVAYLPEGVDLMYGGFTIRMEATNLTTLPTWLEDENLIYYLAAGGTPLCEHVVLKMNASELNAKRWLKNVDCREVGDTPTGVYPLEVEVRDDEVW